MACWRIAVVIAVEAPPDADDGALAALGFAIVDAAHDALSAPCKGVMVWTVETDALQWARDLGLVPDR